MSTFHNTCRISGHVCLDHSVPVYRDGIDILTDGVVKLEHEPVLWEGDQA